jgi:Fe-S oxidoreductase
MFPHDPEAQRLWEQSYTLSEFLQRKVQGYEPPQLLRNALVHGHCHHKAIMKFGPEQELLEKMGLDIHMPETGCCGMAGSFGFEADKYSVSVKCGERVLLPAVREAAEDTLILADGFSCMEQIKQLTGREAMHLAQVIEMALRTGGKSKSSGKLKPFVKAMERTPPGVKLKDTPRGG